MALDHILLGVGLGNWNAFYPRYDQGDVLHIQSAPRRPHNDYLWILSELELLGFLSFVWCFAGPVRATFQERDVWPITGLCSAACVSAHAYVQLS
jgi:O-antigen ligase